MNILYDADKMRAQQFGSTLHGDADTFREFDAMFKNAGFSRSVIHPLPPTPEQVIISDK